MIIVSMLEDQNTILIPKVFVILVLGILLVITQQDRMPMWTFYATTKRLSCAWSLSVVLHQSLASDFMTFQQLCLSTRSAYQKHRFTVKDTV